MIEADLVGSYDLASPYYSGSLDLREDKTFVQKFILPSGKVETARGRWNYRPPLKGALNRGTVGIYGAIVESDGKLDQKESDFVISMPVFVDRKGIALFLNPDGDHAYIKTPK